jgi:hypothetical protein
MSNEIDRPVHQRQEDARAFITEDLGPSGSRELVPADAPVARAERRLASEDIVVSAPMSFHGSAKRIWKIARATPDNDLATMGLSVLAVLLIACAWAFVLAWYLIFGIFLIPYRLVRRGDRTQKRNELRHREMLAAARGEEE